ncbi:MAG: glycerol-3-phosphate dehydrogenase subunit GlpB [Desulforhabdus sp.]|jgi:glycerol-3-phosphate dehydrogenase subunit B|nr:glycerol-3-phosphate dehydrogenase subunit GlpB [Desulforhabdus sp.]
MTASAAVQKTELMVVGTGLTGSAATAFAAARGIDTIQIGSTPGQTLFASGLLDLLGIHPLSLRCRWDNPWAGIISLINDLPEHPYAKAGMENIHKAWKSFLEILHRAGLHYCGWPEANAVLATCAGTLKTTWQVPRTMWPGVLGLQDKRSALIIDFEGMKEFSAVQVVETLRDRWPGLRAQRLEFPCTFPGVDRQNIFLAEALESQHVRKALAEAILPFIQNAELIGMPAILGMHQSEAVAADLGKELGRPVFEIPTMPLSVPGLRLMGAIEKQALRAGAVIMHGVRATAVKSSRDRIFSVSVEADHGKMSIESEGVILATGRFLGGGLAASRSGIRETLLELPVYQPKLRDDWHRTRFLDSRGHPINQAGLEIDGFFRPLGRNNEIAYENLFAAGSLLAHQDWVRMKCGAGLAITTAFAAVQSFLELR